MNKENKEKREPFDALFVMKTVLKSLGLILVLPLMAGALLIMLMYGNMLVHYERSERVYPAAAEYIDPALDGRLVRVCGPLVTAEKSLTFRENEEYPDALEVQEGFVGTASCHAEQLSVGKRKVQGLYAEDRYPFGYFLPSWKADGIEEIQGPTGRVYVLKSGAPVTLIGRQSGDTIDMSDPVSRADLGEISPRYAGHINNLNADFPIESVEGAALIAACVYVLLWVLLGFLLRRRYLGLLLGLVGLLLMLLAACLL